MRFAISVWEGNVGEFVTGPCVLPEWLTGETCRRLLRDTLPLLENVPIGMWRRTWFQHDGAPSLYPRIARDYPDAVFPGRWIGRGGPVSWPPDIPPLEVYECGHIKSLKLGGLGQETVANI